MVLGRAISTNPPKNLLKEFFKSFTSDSMAPSFLVVHTQAANSAGNVVEAEVVVALSHGLVELFHALFPDFPPGFLSGAPSKQAREVAENMLERRSEPGCIQQSV